MIIDWKSFECSNKSFLRHQKHYFYFRYSLVCIWVRNRFSFLLGDQSKKILPFRYTQFFDPISQQIYIFSNICVSPFQQLQTITPLDYIRQTCGLKATFLFVVWLPSWGWVTNTLLKVVPSLNRSWCQIVLQPQWNRLCENDLFSRCLLSRLVFWFTLV